MLLAYSIFQDQYNSTHQFRPETENIEQEDAVKFDS